MADASRDVRFGHDLGETQDETGVDLTLLREQLARSVEERLRRLEQKLAFAEGLRAAKHSDKRGR